MTDIQSAASKFLQNHCIEETNSWKNELIDQIEGFFKFNFKTGHLHGKFYVKPGSVRFQFPHAVQGLLTPNRSANTNHYEMAVYATVILNIYQMKEEVENKEENDDDDDDEDEDVANIIEDEEENNDEDEDEDGKEPDVEIEDEEEKDNEEVLHQNRKKYKAKPVISCVSNIDLFVDTDEHDNEDLVHNTEFPNIRITSLPSITGSFMCALSLPIVNMERVYGQFSEYMTLVLEKQLKIPMIRFFNYNCPVYNRARGCVKSFHKFRQPTKRHRTNHTIQLKCIEDNEVPMIYMQIPYEDKYLPVSVFVIAYGFELSVFLRYVTLFSANSIRSKPDFQIFILALNTYAKNLTTRDCALLIGERMKNCVKNENEVKISKCSMDMQENYFPNLNVMKNDVIDNETMFTPVVPCKDNVRREGKQKLEVLRKMLYLAYLTACCIRSVLDPNVFNNVSIDETIVQTPMRQYLGFFRTEMNMRSLYAKKIAKRAANMLSDRSFKPFCMQDIFNYCSKFRLLFTSRVRPNCEQRCTVRTDDMHNPAYNMNIIHQSVKPNAKMVCCSTLDRTTLHNQCPIATQENKYCGFKRPQAINQIFSPFINPDIYQKYLFQLLVKNKLLVPLWNADFLWNEHDIVNLEKYNFVVGFYGEVMGVTENVEKIYQLIRISRRSILPIYTGMHVRDRMFHITLDAGRSMSLFKVKGGNPERFPYLLPQQRIRALLHFGDLELIDTMEQNSRFVKIDVEKCYSNIEPSISCTHFDFPALLFSPPVLSIGLGYNQEPKVFARQKSYRSGITAWMNQKLTKYLHHSLIYAETDLFKSHIQNSIPCLYNDRCRVTASALILNDPRNVEDSVFVSKKSIDMGLFKTQAQRMFVRTIPPYEKICNPKNTNLHRRQTASSYFAIDDQGLPIKGMKVTNGTIILGVISDKTDESFRVILDYEYEISDYFIYDPAEYEHTSISNFAKLVYPYTDEPRNKTAIIYLRRTSAKGQDRVQIGDKIAIEAQKVTISDIITDEDNYFSPQHGYDMKPDIIISMTAIKRLTQEYIIWMIANRAMASPHAQKTGLMDMRRFRLLHLADNEHILKCVSETLLKNGFSPSGKVPVYRGTDGSFVGYGTMGIVSCVIQKKFAAPADTSRGMNEAVHPLTNLPNSKNSHNNTESAKTKSEYHTHCDFASSAAGVSRNILATTNPKVFWWCNRCGENADNHLRMCSKCNTSDQVHRVEANAVHAMMKHIYNAGIQVKLKVNQG